MAWMFDDLYNAISFLGSWRWPEVMGEITAVDVERIAHSDGNVRLRLAVAYEFSINGDGPYTGESFWNPAFCVNRRVLEAKRKVRVRQTAVVRYRKDDPSVNKLHDWTGLLPGQGPNAPGEDVVQHDTRKRRRSKGSFRLSGSDGWMFAFVYLLIFVILRFDIRRLGSSFQHPMPTPTSAWIAFLVATVFTAYSKIRSSWR